MTRAETARLGLGLGGALAGLGCAMAGGWAGWSAAAVVVLVSGPLAERAFRRLATLDAIRADLAERVRNPPA